MSKHTILYIVLIAATIAAPFLFPSYTAFLATLWLFIVVAQTWDMTGGQMGYNSLGNIFFYGTGMYACAVFAIGLYYPVGEWTDASRSEIFSFTAGQYYTGMIVGIIGAGLFCGVCALVIGPLFFGLRGPYFAIGTLGLAIAAGEIAAPSVMVSQSLAAADVPIAATAIAPAAKNLALKVINFLPLCRFPACCVGKSNICTESLQARCRP